MDAPNTSDGAEGRPGRDASAGSGVSVEPATCTVVDSSPAPGSAPTRPSLTAKRSAKSDPTKTSHGADGGLVGEVADDQVLAHPLAHVPGAEDHQRGVGPAGSGQAARHEGGRERVVGHRGQGLGSDPVRPAPRTGTRIRVSRTKRPWAAPVRHVPRPPADGEGRLVDQCDHPGRGVQLRDRAGEVPRVGHGGYRTGRPGHMRNPSRHRSRWPIPPIPVGETTESG